MILKFLTVASSVLVLSACATLDQGFDALNKGLAVSGQILGGTATTTPQTGSGGALVANISPQQLATIQKNIQSSGGNAQMQRAVSEASPNIVGILRNLSCASGSSWVSNHVGRYAASSQVGGFVSIPMNKIESHRPTECLTVQRINEWALSSENTLSFRVMFISDQNDQTAGAFFQMAKQQNGEWLLIYTY
ncbi:MAG: hypothetical protein VXW65_06135 [Pseudomonadota bacterium]|nr:hypothetical protein [Pseudomonadota bacterium]